MTTIFIYRLHRTSQVGKVENNEFLPHDCNVEIYGEAGPTQFKWMLPISNRNE